MTGRERFEAACAKALEINGLEPTMIENVLKRGLERAPAAEAAQAAPPRMHGNIRGSAYYGQGEVK